MRRKGIVRAARRTSRAMRLPPATRLRLRPLLKARATAEATSMGATRGPPHAFGVHPRRPYALRLASLASALRAAHSVGCRALRAHSPGALRARSANTLGELIATR